MGDHHEQELPPFRLISRWNQVLRSDLFHIGQGRYLSTCRKQSMMATEALTLLF
ncbi:MAG: hypothetical protein KZQ63_15190 [Candidatus Thiodiazotropha sp. (ex Lucinoma aequizonata)]|nr:hypothetical protein [Candidatus Thiodiazotropha sp. (ex Lucinoma aequizonata)]